MFYIVHAARARVIVPMLLKELRVTLLEQAQAYKVIGTLQELSQVNAQGRRQGTGKREVLVTFLGYFLCFVFRSIYIQSFKPISLSSLLLRSLTIEWIDYRYIWAWARQQSFTALSFCLVWSICFKHPLDYKAIYICFGYTVSMRLPNLCMPR